MSMFCYQCQETAKGTGCEVRGVCGKTEEVAKLQDLLIYSLKGIAEIVVKGKLDVKELGHDKQEELKGLFMTITNANFDAAAFETEIKKMLTLRKMLKAKVTAADWHDAVTSKSIRRKPCWKRRQASACWRPRTKTCVRCAK